MNELKPCPFCGNEAKEHAAFSSGIISKVGVYVECSSCGASTSTFWKGEQQQQAVNAWNTRACECDIEGVLDTIDDMVQKAKQTSEYGIGDGLTIKRDGLSESNVKRYATWIREALGVEK